MLELVAGKLRVTLDPQLGGAIASFTWGDLAVLQPVSDPRLGAQHGCALAGYPLVPFANRVAWGRFEFEGKAYRLRRNFGDHPHTIHGNGWMRSWRVEEDTATSARLVLDYAPPDDAGEAASEWPFAYCAEQVFTLDEHGLVVDLRVWNTDDRDWPAGIGLHPYVTRTPQTTLEFNADTVWTSDKDALPATKSACAAHWSSTRQNRSARAWWIIVLQAGTERSQYAGRNTASACAFPRKPRSTICRLYTPVGEAFCGIEPVSNMPDAINRIDDTPDQGLVVLKPGEMLGGTVRFEIVAADSS